MRLVHVYITFCSSQCQILSPISCSDHNILVPDKSLMRSLPVFNYNIYHDHVTQICLLMHKNSKSCPHTISGISCIIVYKPVSRATSSLSTFLSLKMVKYMHIVQITKLYIRFQCTHTQKWHCS